MDDESIERVIARIANADTDNGIKSMLGLNARKRIHCVYARENWPGLSDDDWVRISPAVVLATNFLECYQTSVFLYDLQWDPRRLATETNQDPAFELGIPMYRFGIAHGLPLTVQDSEDLDKVLQNLSKAVTFYMSDRYENSNARPGEQPIYGATHPHGSPIKAGEPGLRSILSIRRAYLNTLDPRTASPDAMLVNWFLMAVTIVHETIHAFAYHTDGNIPEPFFLDQNFAELGAALEVFLFRGAFQIEQWPERLGNRFPQAMVTVEGSLDFQHPHWQVQGDRSNWCHVRREWVLSLFCSTFWAARPASFYPDTDFAGTLSGNGVFFPS